MGLILVTGAGGLLGREVARVFAAHGREVRALPRAELDVSDREAVIAAVGAARPDLIVHCAALTNVDECEEQADRAFAVNAVGAGNVAQAAAGVDAEVVAVSTDYVFDGTKGSPYTESDGPNPIQTYGATKLAGEELVRSACPRHHIVRSAWIYGHGGRNFLSKLPELARSGGPIRAVTDQRGSPTYAPDLAEAILLLAGTGAFGTYHVVNEGACTFAEFCGHALGSLGATVEIDQVRRADLGRPAPRPADTSLEGKAWARAGFAALRPWRNAAEAFCESSSGRSGGSQGVRSGAKPPNPRGAATPPDALR